MQAQAKAQQDLALNNNQQRPSYKSLENDAVITYQQLKQDSTTSSAPLEADEKVEVSSRHSFEIDNTSTSSSSTIEREATYYNLIRYNRSFRLFIYSCFATMAGKWFNYVASINCIEKIMPNSYLAVSLLVVVRLTPNIFTIFGGTIADSYDKRNAMMKLNICSSCIVIQFLLILRYKSILLLYIMTFLQQSLAALYKPIQMSFIPLLVENDDFLKKAITFNSLVWSVMAAFGAGLGGAISAFVGVRACFVLDSLSYLVSAVLLYQIGGVWEVPFDDDDIPASIDLVGSKTRKEARNIFKMIHSFWRKFTSMTKDAILYMKTSFFGPLIFIKATASLIYGSSDVLNVSFSIVPGNEVSSSIRLGLLFSCAGIGCLVGPLIAEQFTSMKNLRSLQIAVIVSFGIMGFSFMGMGYLSDENFMGTCIFTILRSFGSSTLWINSSILLQKFTSLNMLGRVSAVEFTSATLCEALSAMVAGILQDYFYWSGGAVCFVISALAFAIFFSWVIFDKNGGGANHEIAYAFSSKHSCCGSEDDYISLL